MNFNDAKQIAESWVGVISGNQAVIDREKTLALPYGWVFFYNSPEFIANPTNISMSLLGNVPILIERVNGELRVLGTMYQERLKEIESELPSACLLMSPEKPRW
jgi:hypothetical protein